MLIKLQAMGYNPIGAAGFCWDSKILMSLLKGDTPLAAAIMCHPSFITNHFDAPAAVAKFCCIEYVHMAFAWKPPKRRYKFLTVYLASEFLKNVQNSVAH